jgi:uncharacterized protein (UPF0332 family)
MIERESVYPEKAQEGLVGAESEFVNERYNNCANRSYYATFQAAIDALEQAGASHLAHRPTGGIISSRPSSPDSSSTGAPAWRRYGRPVHSE